MKPEITKFKPTSKHSKKMSRTPVRIVDLDLSHHMVKTYPQHGSEDHIKELERVAAAASHEMYDQEYQKIVDQSIAYPFKKFFQKKGVNYPKSVMKDLVKDAEHYILILKYHFMRPRPYEAGPGLGIDFPKGPSAFSKSPSFPSGHAAISHLLATALGRIYPDYKTELEHVANTVDRTRLDLGVHYPTDLEAGRRLGKHMGMTCNLENQKLVAESSHIDPTESNIVTKVGIKISIAERINLTDAIDAIKAIPGVTTVRQVGPQNKSELTGTSTANIFVSIVGGEKTPQNLRKIVSELDGINTAVIKNIDGEKYLGGRPQRRKKVQTSESVLRNLIARVLVESNGFAENLNEELTKSDKREIERISRKVAKKEVDSAIKSFVKGGLEKEISKVLGGKASKEEVTKISKNVIKRLYRELSVNYPAIIDRIKV